MKKIIRKRSVTTLILLPSFVFAAVSGIVLYIWPPKGIARKTDFTLLGGDHHVWETLHITGSLLMVAAVIVHLFMNGKVLAAHIVCERTKAGPLPVSREAVIGLLFFALILAAVIGNVFPASAIMDMREGIREWWRSGWQSGLLRG